MSKIIDGVIGHAIGDAMGTPVQFKDRKLFYKPVKEMLDSGAGDKGTWSDDTSMELATIDSFVNCNGWDYEDIMKNFYAWINDAKYTSRGITFDVGTTCLRAIKNYAYNGISPLEAGLNDINSNGNGSLMRIQPVAYYCYYKKLSNNEIYNLTKNISALTHRHDISILGCYIYILYMVKLLHGEEKKTAYDKIKNEDYSMFSEETKGYYKRILKDDISSFSIDEINSSGYVVDSLEAAMWSVLRSEDFRETIVKAINLGGDTDTIGAIAGSMAGIIYEYENMPEEWTNSIARKDYIVELCNKFEKAIVGD